MIDSTSAIDLEDLKKYDTKIKEYINEKEETLISRISAIESKIDDDTNNTIVDAIKTLDARVDDLSSTVSAHTQSIVNLQDHIDENEAEIIRLQEKDDKISDQISDIRVEIERIKGQQLPEDVVTTPVLTTILSEYATKEFVSNSISAIDLSSYATKEQVENTVTTYVDKEVQTIVENSVQEGIETGKIAISYSDF